MVWSEGGGEDDPIRQEVKARKNNSKIKQEDMINTRRRWREGKAGDMQNIKNQNRNKNSINPKKSRTMKFINRWVLIHRSIVIHDTEYCTVL